MKSSTRSEVVDEEREYHRTAQAGIRRMRWAGVRRVLRGAVFSRIVLFPLVRCGSLHIDVHYTESVVRAKVQR